MEGSIDDLNRPYVRIDMAGFSDSIVGFIDTGFNGALIVDEVQAGRMGFVVQRNQRADVRLASQKEESFYLSKGKLSWFDESKSITAYVLIESKEERVERLRRKENEEVLIGTELLVDCRLEIDFPFRQLVLAKVR